MRYIYQFIIAIGLFLSSPTYALDLYAEALYWQASEAIDWALTNNLSLPQQVVSYKTISFDFEPGFRVGAVLQNESWYSRLLYTRYHVKSKAQTNGNVISVSMPGKFTTPFYNTGRVEFTINYDIVDADFYKSIQVGDSLRLNPVIGLRGGWINQRVNTNLQGNISIFDTTQNNFSGIGPKAGLEGLWNFYTHDDYHFSLVSDFSASFLWGDWAISDSLSRSNASQKSHVYVGKRDFGSLTLQELLGVKLDYKQLSLKLGYEIVDWFNQYQVFDNGSGTHTNDLVLQGITLGLIYRS